MFRNLYAIIMYLALWLPIESYSATLCQAEISSITGYNIQNDQVVRVTGIIQGDYSLCTDGIRVTLSCIDPKRYMQIPQADFQVITNPNGERLVSWRADFYKSTFQRGWTCSCWNEISAAAECLATVADNRNVCRQQTSFHLNCDDGSNSPPSPNDPCTNGTCNTGSVDQTPPSDTGTPDEGTSQNQPGTNNNGGTPDQPGSNNPGQNNNQNPGSNTDHYITLSCGIFAWCCILLGLWIILYIAAAILLYLNIFPVAWYVLGAWFLAFILWIILCEPTYCNIVAYLIIGTAWVLAIFGVFTFLGIGGNAFVVAAYGILATVLMVFLSFQQCRPPNTVTFRSMFHGCGPHCRQN